MESNPINPPINICHIVSGDLWAGAENQVYNIIAGLKEVDCRVIVIVMNKGKLYNELRKLGVETFLVDEKKMPLLGQLVRVLRIIRKNDVAIVHSHRYKENIIAGMIKLLYRNFLLMKTQHGTFDIIKNMSAGRMRIYRLIDLSFTKTIFDKTIGVSVDISNQFNKHINNNKISTVSNSICNYKYTVLDRGHQCGNSKDKPIRLTFIGRLVKIKNIEEFIKISQILCDSKYYCMSYIVGSGPETDHLKKISGELYTKGAIQFLGEIDNVSEVLNKTDILLITSIHEGIPTVLLEAMYFGKIVISRSVGGIPEVIDNNINGFLYSSVAEAISLITEIYENPSKFNYIRTNAKNMVKNNYSYTIQAKKYMAIYRTSLLEGIR